MSDEGGSPEFSPDSEQSPDTSQSGVSHPDPTSSQWADAVAAAARLIEFDQVRLTFDHWCSLWSDGGLPARKAIDPTEIGPSLSYVFVMDYEQETRTLTYRLLGEQVRATYPRPVKGKTLSEVVRPKTYPVVASYFLACPERPAIALVTGRLYSAPDMPAYGQRLLLPLFNSEGGGAGVLGVTYVRRFYDTDDQVRRKADRTLSIFPLDGSDVPGAG